jgi:hypothetical protein
MAPATASSSVAVLILHSVRAAVALPTDCALLMVALFCTSTVV